MPYPWRCISYIVSSVSTITTKKNSDIKSIFGANVHQVSGFCLLGIGGARYIGYKIMDQKPYFHIFYFFLKLLQMALHIMAEDSLNIGHHSLLKL